MPGERCVEAVLASSCLKGSDDRIAKNTGGGSASGSAGGRSASAGAGGGSKRGVVAGASARVVPGASSGDGAVADSSEPGAALRSERGGAGRGSERGGAGGGSERGVARSGVGGSADIAPSPEEDTMDDRAGAERSVPARMTGTPHDGQNLAVSGKAPLQAAH
jgi:hypothetical protein